VSEGNPTDAHAVSTQVLADQLAWLKDEGYEFVRLKTLLLPVVTGQPRKLAVVTFDDGYRDFLTCALPVLERHSVPATVFLVTGLMGQVSTWSSSKNRVPLLTAGEVREVKSRGSTLGSHTLAHLDLTAVDANELHRQLAGSQQALAELGETFHSLAYPWGRCTQREAEAARAAGYQCAFTAGRATSTNQADRFQIGRLVASQHPNLKAFRRAVPDFEKNQPIRDALRIVARTARLLLQRRR
jgi:peptidoglycan/xylan/chitin deacetylase (PgdA/CDA1 family)